MNAYIFTEGGLSSGLGHITRCCSLYDELNSRGINTILVVRGTLNHLNALENRNCIYFDWTIQKLLECLCFEQIVSIVDSYNSPRHIYEYISKNSKKALFIDDVNRLEYPKGIVLNPSLYTASHHYVEKSDVKYLLGKDYLILRSPFRNKLNNKMIEKDVSKLLITLGGTDIRNLLPIILKVLQLYPKIVIQVVIGLLDQNKNELKEILELNPNVRLNIDINEFEMKSLMLECDLAISATGQTIYELLSVGTPFIPIKVIDNQAHTVKGLQEYGLANKILNWNDIDLFNDLKNEIDYFYNYENRKKMNEKYSEVFLDFNGVSRIISELLSL